VTLSAGQTVTGAVSASLGVNAGTTATVDVDFCYSTADAPQPFYGYTYVKTQLSGPMQIVSDTAAMGPLEPNGGTYNVGLCARNESSTVAIDQNDYVTGWLLVANGQILTG
jgi:hypothetical protein